MRPVNPAASVAQIRVGEKLRAARQAQGLTIAQLAELTSLTKGYLSRVERDQTSPSVATLAAICQALAISVGSLFEQSQQSLISLAEAPLINLGGRSAVERMVTPRGQTKIQVIHSDIAPNSNGGDRLYTINCETEVLHVFAGNMTLIFADREIELTAGDTITFKGSEPHNWRSECGAKALWALVPAPWASVQQW